jgi:DnaK suppressor protein
MTRIPGGVPLRQHPAMRSSRRDVVNEANGTFEAVRQRLLHRRTELLGRAERVSADMRHEIEPLSPDSAEQAVQRGNDAVLASIGEAAATELSQLDAALERLAAQRYGLCESCGAPIEVRRLAAVPYALRCIRCVET